MAEVQKSQTQSAEMAQRFAQFIMMQAQNVLFVLGKIPTPDGAMMPPNLQAGKMLIDQMEMLRLKTEGNLSKQEAKIFDDALESVNLAFVEASGGTPASMMPSRTPQFDLPEFEEDEMPEPDLPSPPQTVSAVQPESAPDSETPVQPEDDKRKFYKSYG